MIPLVHGNFLGSDGLRGVGAQISWTMPVPWYSQLFLECRMAAAIPAYSFRNPGDNGTFFNRLTTDREIRGLQDFVYVPRWENSVDLSPTQTVCLAESREPLGLTRLGLTPIPRFMAQISSTNGNRQGGRRVPVCEMADRSDVSPL